MKNRIFGTDGIRGVIGTEITVDLALGVGKSLAKVLENSQVSERIIIVGRDTRVSGELVLDAVRIGINSQGFDVIDIGVTSTPAIPYLIKKYRAAAGVMISASHNPFEYNGIKIFDKNGLKLKDFLEDEVQLFLEENDFKYRTGNEIGKVIREDGSRHYIDYVCSTASKSFKGLNILIDCANGSLSNIACEAFERLGATVTTMFNTPNGVNINDNCGSTHIESLKKHILLGDFDIGFAFDGDGDRCFAVDGNGVDLNGDKMLAVLSRLLKKENKLKNNTVVSTVMSNIGLLMYLKNNGLIHKETKVGDRYVLEEMLEKGYNLGGEESGHIIMLDYNTTGDGLMTAVQMVDLCLKHSQCLNTLATSTMKDYPQVLINVKVTNKNKYDLLEKMSSNMEVKRVQNELIGNGRLVLRVSGTEPLIRVMVEGQDYSKINDMAKSIEKEIVNLNS